MRVGLWGKLSTEELIVLNCDVGEDSWESLGLQGDQSWVFFEITDTKAETPILWLPHVKSWLTGKDPDAGRDWGQEEKGMTEDEIAGWHHWLDGHEFEWTPGVGDGQGVLSCCDSWGRKESDKTEQLNWTELRLSEAWVDSYQMLKCDYPEAGYLLLTKLGFPGVSDSSVCLQCWRPEFHSWFGKIPWRRKWQSTPILLPEKFQGGRSLKGYSPWGCKESDTTEQLHFLSKLIYLYWNHLLLISWLS